MPGVEILDTQTIVTIAGGEFNVGAFMALLFIFIIIGFTMGCALQEEYAPILGAIFGTIVGIFFGILVGAACATPVVEKTEIQHKVIVSDEVTMNDFLAKYDIIEQEGKIYTVVEKEEN